jgi:hypothetical protein
MFRWLRRRREDRSLIEKDADDLIERFGDQAYSEATIRDREGLAIVDGNRPAGHWSRVRLVIAKRGGWAIGLNGYEQFSDDYN